ncbi:FAS1-like dehydratase domain-containing protein [Sphingobium estronivorans]|uniref:FAS1-like dehydratase domain-containing protein n=1 Tax=Sphingobium estronivorans TaxID=1577690 RepID=UPI0013C2E13B|nr:MaoC family dehydratase N-terminal domain-containing protein [Sphingobium estronivorans]
MNLDIDHLRLWIGSEREYHDIITPRLANSLSAILDGAVDLKHGDPAPAGIHWCLAPDIAPMHLLGSDGHPPRGDFLPPVPLPRRMWAGGQLRFRGEFLVGQSILCRSRIEDVYMKQGKGGILCFVTVEHDYFCDGDMILNERQDIVYREMNGSILPLATAASGPSATVEAQEKREVISSSTLLQRYSAVTFNSHKIHYDREYCRGVENYPDLVVHGPLQATCLLSLACGMANGRYPSIFDYRAARPLFLGRSFHVQGDMEGEKGAFAAIDHTGAITMSAIGAWTDPMC